MSNKRPGEQVPSAELIRLAVVAAIAAGMTGFVVGYLKFLGKGPVYFLTGSHGGDGAVASVLAAVMAFLICARSAEELLGSVGGKLAAARYAMIGIGAGFGLVIGLLLTFSINLIRGM